MLDRNIKEDLKNLHTPQYWNKTYGELGLYCLFNTRIQYYNNHISRINSKILINKNKLDIISDEYVKSMSLNLEKINKSVFTDEYFLSFHKESFIKHHPLMYKIKRSEAELVMLKRTLETNQRIIKELSPIYESYKLNKQLSNKINITKKVSKI